MVNDLSRLQLKITYIFFGLPNLGSRDCNVTFRVRKVLFHRSRRPFREVVLIQGREELAKSLVDLMVQELRKPFGKPLVLHGTAFRVCRLRSS